MKFKLGFIIFIAAFLVQGVGFASDNTGAKKIIPQFSETYRSSFFKELPSYNISIFSTDETSEEDDMHDKIKHAVLLFSDIQDVQPRKEFHYYSLSQTFAGITSVPLYIRHCVYLI